MGRASKSVYRLTTGWTVRGSNLGWGEIFRTCSDRRWGPHTLLYNGYRVFPRGKLRPRRTADHSPPSSAAVMKEYSYTSTQPLVHNRACNGNTLPFIGVRRDGTRFFQVVQDRSKWQAVLDKLMNLIFVVPCIMVNSEIIPTRCNNCVYSSQWLYSTCFG